MNQKKEKKKVDNLNFKNSKQFSFEDFRDSKLLYDDNKINGNKRININKRKNEKAINLNITNSQEDSKLKDTMYSSQYSNLFIEEKEKKDNNIVELSDEDDFSNK